jgi:hypothetical protein
MKIKIYLTMKKILTFQTDSLRIKLVLSEMSFFKIIFNKGINFID